MESIYRLSFNFIPIKIKGYRLMKFLMNSELPDRM